jgi:hypothetical protein
MLEPIADGLWVEARRLRFAGVETGTRMTLVRLADGGLFVHSPISLDAGTPLAAPASFAAAGALLGQATSPVADPRAHL